MSGSLHCNAPRSGRYQAICIVAILTYALLAAPSLSVAETPAEAAGRMAKECEPNHPQCMTTCRAMAQVLANPPMPPNLFESCRQAHAAAMAQQASPASAASSTPMTSLANDPRVTELRRIAQECAGFPDSQPKRSCERRCEQYAAAHSEPAATEVAALRDQSLSRDLEWCRNTQAQARAGG